jgi:hypothetical protein
MRIHLADPAIRNFRNLRDHATAHPVRCALEPLEPRRMLSALRNVQIPVLEFHRIRPDGSRLNSADITVSHFNHVLDALARKGFQTVPLETYYQWRSSTSDVALPDHPVIMTFDDANLTHLTTAAPAMKNFNWDEVDGNGNTIHHTAHFKGVAAIPTGLVGQRSGTMTWPQVRQLYGDFGWDIASHSVDHLWMGDGKRRKVYTNTTHTRHTFVEAEVSKDQFTNTPDAIYDQLHTSQNTLQHKGTSTDPRGVWDENGTPDDIWQSGERRPTVRTFIYPFNDVTAPSLIRAADTYQMIFGLTAELVRDPQLTMEQLHASFRYIGDTTSSNTRRPDLQDGRLIRTAIVQTTDIGMLGTQDYGLLGTYLEYAKSGSFSAPPLAVGDIPTSYIATDGTLMVGGNNSANTIVWNSAGELVIDDDGALALNELRFPYDLLGLAGKINHAGGYPTGQTVLSVDGFNGAVATGGTIWVNRVAYTISAHAETLGKTTSITIPASGLTGAVPDKAVVSDALENPVILGKTYDGWRYSADTANRALLQVNKLNVTTGDGQDYVQNQLNYPSSIYGGAGPDQLYGGSGDDYIEGNAGTDSIYGGPGRDRLHGGLDDDILYGGSGIDNLYGDEGTDTFHTRDNHLDHIYKQDASDSDILDIDIGMDIVQTLR